MNHGGDSDSTGAIAGNLLGAKLGIGAIPARWLEELEARETIDELARDLAGAAGEAPSTGSRHADPGRYPPL